MAQLILVTTMSNLRRDFTTLDVPGGPLDLMLVGFHQIAVDALREVEEQVGVEVTHPLRGVHAQDRLSVEVATGIGPCYSDTGFAPETPYGLGATADRGDPADPVGVLTFTITAGVPVEYTYNFQADGTVGAGWRDLIADRVPEAFAAAGPTFMADAVSTEGAGGFVVTFDLKAHRTQV